MVLLVGGKEYDNEYPCVCGVGEKMEGGSK